MPICRLFEIAPVVAALLLGSVAAAQTPERNARLTIDGEAYNVPLGKAFALRIDGRRVNVRIDLQTALEFEAAGVAFRYPTALDPGQPDAGEGVRIWTFQGEKAAIMVQKYDNELAPEGLRDVLVENLVGDSGAKPQAVKLTGADRAYTGVQVRTKSAGRAGAPPTESVQNLFTFANTEGVFALIVQDVRPTNEGDSAEYSEALRLLSESLTTGQPAPAEQREPTANADR